MARKRADPGDDLLTRMVQEHDADPNQLSEGEIVANAILFLNAGHEAVVNVLGNGMRALLEHPEAVAALRADPALWPGAIEEMMRFDTPLQFFERRVLQPMDYGGCHWPQGTKLVLYYAAANRDPEVFSDPDRFDIRRTPNPHLAFGLGLHYCIGAPLARLELGIGLAGLFERFPGLALTQEPLHYEPKNVFRYLRALPLRF
jgi:unspecific monooxygenase